ncbi:hypothetical protein N0V90_012639 [Kalmusia sp. IMI 367209]|nr:hypothetical protein N0V90_012639 [Kalmusia sp. IMI 367209]
MATALSSSILEQLKHEFCNRYSNLPEQERQQLWLQTVGNLPSSNTPSPHHPSHAHEVPRSMSNQAVSITQLNTNFGPMGRVQSAPATQAMEQSMSISSDNNLQRSSSTLPGWQQPFDESSNAYTVYSESAAMRRQPLLQPIEETAFSSDSMVEYSPSDYINFIESSGSPQLPLSQSHSQSQLHVQLTPNDQWIPSLDDPRSPSTPSTALMTPVTLSSNSMSRQSSFNPHFVDMLRVQSDSSTMYPIISEDGSFSFPASDVNVVSKNISSFADTPHFLATSGFTGLPSETAFLSTTPVSSASASALASSENETPCLVEDMRRSASTSSESDASSASASSLRSRHVRREREINAQAGRCRIAPKAIPSNPQTKSASSNARMMRIQSEDGSSKHVGVISKTPYVRPQHPKILCPHCSERPEGFRGTHELERHVARAHTAVRKGYICVAPAFNKKFLNGCKHCRNEKVYGAYYNAAAHLRRAHFHPRKRGRKGKNDEKRGGIGGGDDPPMDYLKQHWIREIEVENKMRSKSTASQSPESASDSAAEMDSFDASYDADLAYPPLATQSATDASMSVSMDPNQYVDYAMCSSLNESDAALYNQTIMYAAQAQAPTSDISMNDFEFDAYRT